MAEHEGMVEEHKGMDDRIVAAFMFAPLPIILLIIVLIPVIAPGPR